MKLKFKDQYVSFTHTLAVGVNIDKVDAFPVLSGSDAFVLNRIKTEFDAGSASATITGAGLMIFSFALAGRSQSVPADLLSTINLVYLVASSSCVTAAGGIHLSSSYLIPDVYPLSPSLPIREVYGLGHTVNVTNAATTILRVGCFYDIVTLSNSEYIQYLR